MDEACNCCLVDEEPFLALGGGGGGGGVEKLCNFVDMREPTIIGYAIREIYLALYKYRVR